MSVPNVSDTDLANILIRIPDEEVIKQISQKVKKAFELRQESKKELAMIDFGF